jgi:hypothetical protein
MHRIEIGRQAGYYIDNTKGDIKDKKKFNGKGS